jgi:hypothetical protein
MTRLNQINLWLKPMSASVSKPLHSIAVEPITDDMALEVRGGDKDYYPTYEYQKTKQSSFSDPSMLLDL